MTSDPRGVLRLVDGRLDARAVEGYVEARIEPAIEAFLVVLTELDPVPTLPDEIMRILNARRPTGRRELNQDDIHHRKSEANTHFRNNGASQDVVIRLSGGGYVIAPIPAVEEPGPTNLEPDELPILGRDADIAALEELIASERAVVVTGAPGTGKTRLAREVGRRLRTRYAGGVWLARIAPLERDELLLPWVASELRVAPEEKDIVRRLAALLGPDPTLLVVDNLEHVIDQASSLTELLVACPLLRILITSQFALAIEGPRSVAGASHYALAPLEVPSTSAEIADSPSVRLFCDIARRTAGRDPCRDQPEVVAEICRELDGMPLAIRLAASRARELSPLQILEELRTHLFTTTSGGQGGARASLEGAIGWTYGLLDDKTRRMLEWISVFRGGFTREALDALAAAMPGGAAADRLEPLGRLIDASLVTSEEGPAGPRYDLLEPIRLYAVERSLGSPDTQSARDAHAAWCLAEAKRLDGLLGDRESLHAVARFEAERANMRAALAWLGGDPAGHARWLDLAIALSWFWTLRGDLKEGRSTLAAALADRDVGTPRQRAMALNRQAGLARMQGDFPEATGLYEQARALARATADAFNEGFALNGLGRIQAAVGQEAPARVLYGEALAIRREMARDEPRRRPGVAITLDNIADLDLAQHRLDEAIAGYLEAYRLRRSVSDVVGTAISHDKLGRVELVRGRPRHAGRLLAGALRRFRELGHRDWIANTLDAFAELALDVADRVADFDPSASRTYLREAAVLRAATDVLHDLVGTQLAQPEAAERREIRRRLRSALEPDYRDCELEGRGLSEDAAAMRALALATAICDDPSIERLPPRTSTPPKQRPE